MIDFLKNINIFIDACKCNLIVVKDIILDEESFMRVLVQIKDIMKYTAIANDLEATIIEFDYLGIRFKREGLIEEGKEVK